MVERMLDTTIGVGSHCRRRYCYRHSYWSRIPKRRNIRIQTMDPISGCETRPIVRR